MNSGQRKYQIFSLSLLVLLSSNFANAAGDDETQVVRDPKWYQTNASAVDSAVQNINSAFDTCQYTYQPAEGGDAIIEGYKTDCATALLNKAMDSLKATSWQYPQQVKQIDDQIHQMMNSCVARESVDHTSSDPTSPNLFTDTCMRGILVNGANVRDFTTSKLQAISTQMKTRLGGLPALLAKDAKAQKAAATDPTYNLDCKNLKLAPDVVPDPMYYYDAINGIQATEARLNDYVTQQNTGSFSGQKAKTDLTMMLGWMTPATQRYSQIKDLEQPLTSCLNGTGGCNMDFSNDGSLSSDSVLAQIKSTLPTLKGVEADMVKKLATMRACDPVIQSKPGRDTFASKVAAMKAQLKTPAQLALMQTQASAKCVAPTISTNPMGTSTTDGLQTILQSVPPPPKIVVAPAPPARAPAVDPSTIPTVPFDSLLPGGANSGTSTK